MRLDKYFIMLLSKHWGFTDLKPAASTFLPEINKSSFKGGEPQIREAVRKVLECQPACPVVQPCSGLEWRGSKDLKTQILC